MTRRVVHMLAMRWHPPVGFAIGLTACGANAKDTGTGVNYTKECKQVTCKACLRTTFYKLKCRHDA